MTNLQILLGLSVFGIFQTAYLIYKRRRDEHPVCVIGKGCSVVLDSKYNKTLGIHNDILGLMYYVAAGVSIGLGLPYEFLGILIGIGAISSLVFMYIQFFVLKSFCFWCTASAVTVFTMVVVWILS